MDVRHFFDSGFNILLVSYRGFGSSQGRPSERGMRKDAIAAVEYCMDRGDVLDTQQIFLFGRSIGGAVAIATATTLARDNSTQPLAGVVVENTFTSMGDMIDVVLPPLRFVKFLNRNPWGSVSTIGNLELPMLFISGLCDELVPPHHVKTLYDSAQKSRIRRLHTVPDGTHNDTYVTSLYSLVFSQSLVVFPIALHSSRFSSAALTH